MDFPNIKAGDARY